MTTRFQEKRNLLFAIVTMLALGWNQPALRADSEIAAGTHFVVELKDTLAAKDIKRGKRFEARTLEPLQTADGRTIPAGAILKGRIAYNEHNKMMLQFDRIESRRYRLPIVASVTRVMDEKDVKDNPGEEGEIQAHGERGKDAGIGAVAGGGIGAAAGAAAGGGKGAAIGAGAGAALGALFGAAAGGKDLVLHQGTRLELQLDRPLHIPYR